MLDIEYLNALRRLEMEQLLPLLPPGARVLEFGAGTGEQARFLADRGFGVTAIDLATSNYAGERLHPIVDYDGRNIPLHDSSVDVVFSSNVLEHVEDLPVVLAEFRRVTKPGGFGLHVMPTPAWRFWSFASAAAESLKCAALLPRDLLHGAALRPALRRVASGFVPRGHGTSVEGVSELWTFSARAWRTRFERNGFDVVDDRPMGLFYTGSVLLGETLSTESRRRFSSILGSATHLYKIAARAPDR